MGKLNLGSSVKMNYIVIDINDQELVKPSIHFEDRLEIPSDPELGTQDGDSIKLSGTKTKFNFLGWFCFWKTNDYNFKKDLDLVELVNEKTEIMDWMPKSLENSWNSMPLIDSGSQEYQVDPYHLSDPSRDMELSGAIDFDSNSFNFSPFEMTVKYNLISEKTH